MYINLVLFVHYLSIWLSNPSGRHALERFMVFGMHGSGSSYLCHVSTFVCNISLDLDWFISWKVGMWSLSSSCIEQSLVVYHALEWDIFFSHLSTFECIDIVVTYFYYISLSSSLSCWLSGHYDRLEYKEESLVLVMHGRESIVLL